MYLRSISQLEPSLRIPASRVITTSVGIRTPQDPSLRGGDVFETYERTDGSVSILIADVSSKGILGIAKAQMLRDAFRREARQEDRPSYIMDELNRLPFNGSDLTRGVSFASAVVATISRSTQTLCYSSAGHDAALIVKGRRHVHLGPTGPIIGIMPGASFGDAYARFGTTDLLLLATDGFTECRSESDRTTQFGTTGIVRALGTNPHRSYRSACLAIVNLADIFTGGHYRDDATLAVIARCNEL
jgi:sigma-B regulation protein RsbU (phosphoserine phosphatase)